MKKFQFRLQRLLWYHQQRLKQAEVRLQQVAIQRESAAVVVRQIQQQIESACQLPEHAGQVVNVSARQNMAARLQQLGKSLNSAREILQAADQRLREANQVRTGITRDVEGLLHLRVQQFAEHSDEMARQQQIVLDEIVMRRWSMRDADASG